jgi:hypothetical protein
MRRFAATVSGSPSSFLSSSSLSTQKAQHFAGLRKGMAGAIKWYIMIREHALPWTQFGKIGCSQCRRARADIDVSPILRQNSGAGIHACTPQLCKPDHRA